MGEYVNYRGNEIKIGTLDDLYYATYQKFTTALEAGQLERLPGNDEPASYVQPDTENRFPFPDEDKFELGDIGRFDYDRRLPVKISAAILGDPETDGKQLVELHIRQQNLVHRQSDGKQILALVLKDPVKNELFRIEEDRYIKSLCKEIIANHVTGERDITQRNFYRAIAARILQGYGLSALKELQKQQAHPKIKARKGRSL